MDEREWLPHEHDEDPMVNAILNVAEQIHRLAEATNGLLYGLKYSKADGMSLAEATEVSGKLQSEAIAVAAETIAEAINNLEPEKS